TSNFQPWKMHLSPFSSLRAKASEEQRWGHWRASTPTRPSVARKATRSSPRSRNCFGAPSAMRLAERKAGVQTSRSISPMGVPAPTRVNRSFSSFDSISLLPNQGRSYPLDWRYANRRGHRDMSRADILIRGGAVIDGTGAPAREADVAIAAGRIAAIGPKLAVDASRVIDARGQVVAPGFIDIKTHSDWTLPLNPKAESKIRQGVTTEVIGHCGYSCAPALPGKAGLLKDYLSPSAPWLSFVDQSYAEYLASLPATSTNYVPLVGHNTLRLMVMGLANRAATSSRRWRASSRRRSMPAPGGSRLGFSPRPVPSPRPRRWWRWQRSRSKRAGSISPICATRRTRSSRRWTRRSASGARRESMCRWCI